MLDMFEARACKKKFMGNVHESLQTPNKTMNEWCKPLIMLVENKFMQPKRA